MRTVHHVNKVAELEEMCQENVVPEGFNHLFSGTAWTVQARFAHEDSIDGLRTAFALHLLHWAQNLASQSLQTQKLHLQLTMSSATACIGGSLNPAGSVIPSRCGRGAKHVFSMISLRIPSIVPNKI